MKTTFFIFSKIIFNIEKSDAFNGQFMTILQKIYNYTLNSSYEKKIIKKNCTVYKSF